MFEWYRSASLCVAFLADVSEEHRPSSPSSRFRSSRWFKRGWTLQELIAPDSTMLLVGHSWKVLGTKFSLSSLIQGITGVERIVLTTRDAYSGVPVARRMSWAANRTTTRIEDEAYSLMGLFGVHMPTVYGEGHNAFIRLQEEILKRIPDQSIFTWGPSAGDIDGILRSRDYGILFSPEKRNMSPDVLLATSPKSFANCDDIKSITPETLRLTLGLTQDQFIMPQFTITSYGMRAHLPVIQFRRKGFFLAVLACMDAHGRLVALVLYPHGPDVHHNESWSAFEFSNASPLTASLLSVARGVRTVWLPPKHVKNPIRGWSRAKMGDICIRHRQDARDNVPSVTTTSRMGGDGGYLSPILITGPCEIVLFPWTLHALSRKCFEVTLSLPTATPTWPGSAAIRLIPHQFPTFHLTHRISGEMLIIQFQECKYRASLVSRGFNFHAYVSFVRLEELEDRPTTSTACRLTMQSGTTRRDCQEAVTMGTHEYLCGDYLGTKWKVRLTFAQCTTDEANNDVRRISMRIHLWVVRKRHARNPAVTTGILGSSVNAVAKPTSVTSPGNRILRGLLPQPHLPRMFQLKRIHHSHPVPAPTKRSFIPSPLSRFIHASPIVSSSTSKNTTRESRPSITSKGWLGLNGWEVS